MILSFSQRDFHLIDDRQPGFRRLSDDKDGKFSPKWNQKWRRSWRERNSIGGNGMRTEWGDVKAMLEFNDLHNLMKVDEGIVTGEFGTSWNYDNVVGGLVLTPVLTLIRMLDSSLGTRFWSPLEPVLLSFQSQSHSPLTQPSVVSFPLKLNHYSWITFGVIGNIKRSRFFIFLHAKSPQTCDRLEDEREQSM
jgi:hypothetical protein